MDNELTFGDIIKVRRTVLELSLRKAAKLLGISFGQLHDLESGKQSNPTAATLNKFRRHYHMKAEVLLDFLIK